MKEADMLSVGSMLPDILTASSGRSGIFSRTVPRSPDPTPRIFRQIERHGDRIPTILRKALEALLTGRTPWPGYVFGTAGVGKTCAGLWVFDHFCAMWLDTYRLADICWDSVTETFLWRHASEMPLVIVDEVGAACGERAYLGIKRLADLRGRRPTLWLSNLSPQCLLETFDDRLYSRLCCGTVVEVQGPDQRFLDAS